MPVLTRDETIPHLRQAMRGNSRFVVIGEEAAQFVVADLAVRLVSVVGLTTGQIQFGRFAYGKKAGAELTEVSFATFPAAHVANDTVADLLALSGVPHKPAPLSHLPRAEVILLSDYPHRLILALSKILGPA
jgi:hypothetical protein